MECDGSNILRIGTLSLRLLHVHAGSVSPKAACWRGHTCMLSISRQCLSSSVLLPKHKTHEWSHLESSRQAHSSARCHLVPVMTSQRREEPPSRCMPDSRFTISWNIIKSLLFWTTIFWIVCYSAIKNWHRCLNMILAKKHEKCIYHQWNCLK